MLRCSARPSSILVLELDLLLGLRHCEFVEMLCARGGWAWASGFLRWRCEIVSSQGTDTDTVGLSDVVDRYRSEDAKLTAEPRVPLRKDNRHAFGEMQKEQKCKGAGLDWTGQKLVVATGFGFSGFAWLSCLSVALLCLKQRQHADPLHSQPEVSTQSGLGGLTCESASRLVV